MKEISRNLDGYINRLIPTTGTLYSRVLNTYLSAGLIYGELSNLILVERLYSIAYPNDLNSKIKRNKVMRKLISLWHLRVLCNIGEKQFNTYLSMNPELSEKEDIIGLALKLSDDIKNIAKPNLVITKNVRKAIKQLLVNDNFVVDDKLMYCTPYRPDYLLVTNILNYEISVINSYMLDDIIQAINDVDNISVTTDTFLDAAKHVTAMLSGINHSKASNRLPAMYEPFYDMLDRFILQHDPSHKKNKLTPKRLRVIKG